jgi:TetR/AcrR family transcriptional repressor of mexJK operon
MTMARPTAGKTAGRRGRPMKAGLREHLLLHTLQVLLRDGYEGFSMSAVALSANASKETLYRLFQDKAGLLSAALKNIGKVVEPLLLEGIRQELGQRERLQLLAKNYLRGCLRPESLALQRIAYADGGKHLGPMFTRQFTDAALAVVARQFSEMNTPKPRLDAEIFLAMVQGQMHEKALLGMAAGQNSKKLDELIAHAVGIFSTYLNQRR